MNARTLVDDLADLTFDDRVRRELPGDPETRVFVRQVPGAAWSEVGPTPVAAPRLIAVSAEVLHDLGLSDEAADRPSFVAALAGNLLVPGMKPYAARYAGHQFGSWAGQLGDGRAITLGEVVGAHGRLEVQLKGAGLTPYSRGADGRAVLRSSIREFLCSEAMHHLGVPTTRALALVATGEGVVRDMFYDGHPAEEPGAIVTRVAPSFLRLGNFQVHAAFGEMDALRALFDHTSRAHGLGEGEGERRVITLFAEVVRRTLDLVGHWRRVGFVHGVMNTDNLSVLGLTIDYGPYGWLEAYDPDWTPNTTDAGRRRYRFGQQERVALWNLARFAEALAPLVGRVEPFEEILVEAYEGLEGRVLDVWRAKLGLIGRHADDAGLVADLEAMFLGHETDYILFFRGLADVPDGPPAAPWPALLTRAFYQGPPPGFAAWISRWSARVGPGQAERRARMNAVNPARVLRNWIASEVIDAVTAGDDGAVARALEALRAPYVAEGVEERWLSPRPDWARHRAGCSMLSCSS